MSACLASAVMPWRSLPLAPLRVGSLRFTPYGLCAAVGLMVSMTSVRRCARRAGVDPEAAWDAGLFAILACFVASRLLLVLGSPSAFVHFPLLLLSLPSLTLGGTVLAAGMTVVYVWRKQLPSLCLLDTFAAPAALLGSFLELGHLLDASEAGMPTRLPWSVPASPAMPALRVHPVALYGTLSAALLAWGLWRTLPHARHSIFSGRTAALGLALGGLCAFGLGTLSLPLVVNPTPGLEPGQWVALLAMFAGALLYSLAPRTPGHAAGSDISPQHPPLHMEVH